MSPAIWWIRRDLRLHDNDVLQAALAHSPDVIPLWIFDPFLLRSPVVGPHRIVFLYDGLHALQQTLKARGSQLIVRHGDPLEVLPQVQAQSGATAVFAGADYSPYALRRDRELARRLPLNLLDVQAIHLPGTVLKADGEPYAVFSAFRRRWLALPPPDLDGLPPAPDAFPLSPALESEPTSGEPVARHRRFPAGEAEALRRLDDFARHGLSTYDRRRNDLGEPGTSCLSPYLRFGMLSPRRAAAVAAAHGGDGARAWLDELIWRDFFIHVLYHFPAVIRQSFRRSYRTLRWRRDAAQFAAWQEGRTGYPLVDAAMRELRQTGWLHNRARMVAASFLAKHLLLDWREGERWFRQQLLDGDAAINNGNWQWVAGTGTDAAPYFRIFNPATQGRRYDPDGAYVRRWVPEMAGVPAKYIHEPWKMPAEIQREAGCRIGHDYPQPIVDHASARERALAFYRGLDEPRRNM